MNQQAPYMRVKDYDHEDIEAEFRSDKTLMIVGNVLASLGVFAALMCAIALLMAVPSGWLTWLVLATGGV